MRTVPEAMSGLWDAGGPFVGMDGAPHGRVTVEKDWILNDEATIDGIPFISKLPFRWFQRLDNSQVETEVPNIKSIEIDRSIDTDAGSCTIQLYNQFMDPNDSGQSVRLGDAGYFTWGIRNAAAIARWGERANTDWQNVLIPNALLRTYQGYGGRDKTITDALADGNLILTGVWLIDDISASSDGMLNLSCRDMAKLLIEQQIFEPLIPPAWYPLRYHRWDYQRAIAMGAPVYDSSDPVETSPGEGPKYVSDCAIIPNGRGYWLLGSDGGVFSFGDARFFGGRGGEGDLDSSPMVSIAADPLGGGYWLASASGGVFTFGEIEFYGSGASGTVVAITATASGLGYYLLNSDGAVFTFGDALYYGGGSGAVYVDMAVLPEGNGYWLLQDDGNVEGYGAAIDHGGADNGSGVMAVSISNMFDGSGYWIAREDGDVFGYGATTTFIHHGDWLFAQDLIRRNLGGEAIGISADPIFGIQGTPTGNGYMLVGGSGGVFTFGDAQFHGSLLGNHNYTIRTDGDYYDYADIVKDLLLWSGWHLYGTGDDTIYGNIETTGIWNDEELPPSMFDMHPPIDAINQIKEIVGYHFWIDDEGAARFESPNWYTVGNVLEDGTPTDFIPDIDELVQLTAYEASTSDKAARSEIIITSANPTDALNDTVTTRLVVSDFDTMNRGMVRPAMWVNEHFVSADEQRIMAELIAIHIVRSMRQGNTTCVAFPAIQINDQVRIRERTTNEGFLHYVRGVRTSMDLDSGSYMMTLTTNWLEETLPVRPQGLPEVGSDSVAPDALPAPSILELDPSTSPDHGGGTVIVDGVNFEALAIVQFDGTYAEIVERVADTRIVVICPPHTAGTINVSVTNHDGKRGLSGFTFT